MARELYVTISMHISKSVMGSTSLVSYAARFRTIRPELLAGLERA